MRQRPRRQPERGWSEVSYRDPPNWKLLVVFGEHIVQPYTLKSVRFGGLLHRERAIGVSRGCTSAASNRKPANTHLRVARGAKKKPGSAKRNPAFIRSIVQP